MALKLTSPYRRGADKGLIMGVYLSLMFWGISENMLAVISPDRSASSPTAVAGWALLLCMPVVLYMMLRHSYVKEGGKMTFSNLWLEGIMTYVFGGLIAIVVGYLYMRFLNPSFLGNLYSALPELMDKASQTMNHDDAEQYRRLAHDFEEMRSTGQLPSMLTILFNIMWYIVLFGLLLSLVVAAMARIGRIRSKT